MRSNFQAAMAPASSFAWKSRETGFRLLRLMIFRCISATVLGSESMIGGRTQNVSRWLDSRRQLIYRIAHGLTEIFQPLPVHSPVE